MIWLLVALLAVAALGVVAWLLLPSDEAQTQVEAVDPTAPWVYVDHRDDAQRVADQATVNDAWGL